MADDQATRRDVRATYEAIADHFSKTREYAWPEVESFVENADGVDRAPRRRLWQRSAFGVTRHDRERSRRSRRQ